MIEMYNSDGDKSTSDCNMYDISFYLYQSLSSVKSYLTVL